MSWLVHRRQKSVVVGPITTNAARGRTSRQAHLARESQQPGPERGVPDDHGSTGGGRAASPHHKPRAVGAAQRVAQPASPVIPAPSPTRSHGRPAVGPRRTRSEAGRAPSAAVILKVFPLGGWKILQDHGTVPVGRRVHARAGSASCTVSGARRHGTASPRGCPPTARSAASPGKVTVNRSQTGE